MDNIIKNEIYTGTLESAKDLVNNLLLHECDYYFNPKDGTTKNHREGILYSPGDSYQYAIHQTFECV